MGSLKGELGVPLARFVQQVTPITVVNNTTLTTDIVVPANKRWIFLGFRVVNPDDVARNLTVTLWLEAARTNRIRVMMTQAGVAAGDPHQWPDFTQTHIGKDFGKHASLADGYLLSAGNTITIVWAAGGVSAGGTDADGLVYEYLEVDTP